jgi:hypothetical protein
VPDLQSTLGFTIAAWGRQDEAPTATYDDLACKQLASNDDSYCLGTKGDRPVFYTVGNDLLGPDPVALGVWHHYAMTWDGSTKTGYLDGIEVASIALPTLAFDDSSFVIGAEQSPPKYFWHGAIDDVVLYNRVLSAAEIGQLASP